MSTKHWEMSTGMPWAQKKGRHWGKHWGRSTGMQWAEKKATH
jgi:hypothetical protein